MYPAASAGGAMWSEIGIGGAASMEFGVYPERAGEPDCAYYLRTGICRFGRSCKFNHPPNRNLAIVAARIKGEYPERVGQPECQYYLKTGTCKFGPTCKFHHPREKAGIAGRAELNSIGYPLRPNEKECAYYLKTGQCKFGSSCKFHHPELSSTDSSFRGSSIYTPVQSTTVSGSQSYPGSTWPVNRGSFIPSPRWQGPSDYAPLVVPPGVMHVPSWSTYSGQLLPIPSSESRQLTPGSQPYTTSYQGEPNSGTQGSISSYRSSSYAINQYQSQRENVFPERPGQPECQYYMKTGDCKFGAVCKFHHPKERLLPTPNCPLSQLGLPLRPGEQLCKFYSRYGICKFGPNCKFDHPMTAPPQVGVYAYSFSSNPASVPVVQHLPASTPGVAYQFSAARDILDGTSR